MISIQEIQKIEGVRKAIRKETYTKIYEQFCKRIRHHVELGLKSVTLSVPSFVMGCPTFDRTKAADYLVRQLKNAGFHVERLSTTDIHVDWNIKTRKKKVSTHHEEVSEPDGGLPSLMNLRKLAAKHRGA